MSRLIQQFPGRRRLSLDGVWHFKALDTAPKRPLPNSQYDDILPVPGVWEASFRHFRHRGFGCYQREFEVQGDVATALRLVFEAVSHTAKVWLDDRFLGSHRNAYTGFEFCCPQVRPGRHRLTVLADNRPGPGLSLLRHDVDFHIYGGIPRSVYAEALPVSHITSACALPEFNGRRWELACQVQVRTQGEALPKCAEVLVDGKAVGKIALNREGRGRASVPMAKVERWLPQSPRLYTAAIRIGDDLWQERVGFRTLAVRGRQILLNDKLLILHGVNRHEFHPDFGPALPPAAHLRDMEILKNLGANCVRGSHYPNDSFFLDLCDENGILFWEELSHWQATPGEMARADFRRESLAQIDEMVAQHRHHPSVIFWGMLNEAHSFHPVAPKTFKLFADRFRKLDSTRLITYGSSHPDRDKCFGLLDVVSINTYPGWYNGDLANLEMEIAKVLRTARRVSKGKPILFSEFGAAAIAGAHSFELRRWTEEYQAELMTRVIERLRQSGLAAGAILWQFCDCRSSDALWQTRPGEYNNKGILTAYREPKLAFYRVAEQFRKPWRIPESERGDEEHRAQGQRRGLKGIRRAAGTGGGHRESH